MAKRPVYGWGLLGLGGRFTDPNEAAFTDRVGHELGATVQLHRDYEVNHVAGEIEAAPADAIILSWGSSLGANDQTILASRVKRKIHGIWGFQASIFGAKEPVPSNVLFAHLIYSYNPIPVPGLGAYKWEAGSGFDPARLHLTPHHIPHPGDYDRHDQDLFLAEMKRVIGAPGD